MPPQSPTVLAPRLRRLGRVAALAAVTCAAAGAVIIVIADEQPVAQLRAIAEPNQPAATRYFDIAANKATSMRALGRHIAEQHPNRTTRYQDLEANEAHKQRKR